MHSAKPYFPSTSQRPMRNTVNLYFLYAFGQLWKIDRKIQNGSLRHFHAKSLVPKGWRVGATSLVTNTSLGIHDISLITTKPDIIHIVITCNEIAMKYRLVTLVDELGKAQIRYFFQHLTIFLRQLRPKRVFYPSPLKICRRTSCFQTNKICFKQNILLFIR